MQRVSRQIWIRGRVQGVGFRWSAQNKAAGLGLSGWVRNRGDGRVELRLEGEAAAVEAMLAWLGRGPTGARVDGLDVREREVEGLEGFELLASAP